MKAILSIYPRKAFLTLALLVLKLRPISLGQKECDALILCVPTPLNKYREPDMSFVVNTTEAIKPYLREGQVVSLESTTYPGTTEEELLPRVQSDGLVVGKSIFLVYSPEREDPGNPNFETRTIPKVIGAYPGMPGSWSRSLRTGYR